MVVADDFLLEASGGQYRFAILVFFVLCQKSWSLESHDHEFRRNLITFSVETSEAVWFMKNQHHQG